MTSKFRIIHNGLAATNSIALASKQTASQMADMHIALGSFAPPVMQSHPALSDKQRCTIILNALRLAVEEAERDYQEALS